MADENSESAPVVQSNGAVDLSLRSPHLDEVEDLCNKLVAHHKLTPSSRIWDANSQLSIHGVRDFGVFTIAYGSELTAQIYPNEMDDRLAFVMAGSGAGQVRTGGQEYTFAAGQGIILPSGPEMFMRYDSDCESLAVLLNRRKLAAHCAKLLGYEIEPSLQFETQFALADATGQSWMRLVRYAAAELSQPLSMTRQLPAAQQQLEQTLITTLLLAHRHSYSEALLRPQSPAAPFYVKRAEAFIEAHFAEPLSLADIAAHAGVSARSLQTGFQSFRNTTPMGFLRSLRLRRAHEALLLADPSIATVTEVALRCGFGHMGEFASLYRKTFGETPKQTLAKLVYR